MEKEKKVFKIFRITIAAVAVLFLITFLSTFVSGIINIGNICGGLLCLWIIFIFGTRKKYKEVKAKLKAHIVGKVLINLVNFGFTAFLIYGLTVTGIMTLVSSQKPSQNATAIVLGAEVTDNGPSMILSGRINAALRYLNENPNAKAVLSGGKGKNEPVSEAQAMYDELVKAGISPDRLYIEDKSVNTGENILFSDKIIKENGLDSSIAIVTDGFHQFRAHIIAKQQGVSGSVGSITAGTFPLFAPTFAVREWFALPNQVLFR